MRRGLCPAEVGIVETEVVIVFGPIGRRGCEEIDEAREPELLVPFFAELRERLCGTFGGVVVVNDVARPDEEVGAEREHRGIGREAELTRFGGCPGPFPVGAVHEEGVVLAAPHHERERGVVGRERQCPEVPRRAVAGRRFVGSEDEAVMVTGSGAQPIHFCADDEVIGGGGAEPWGTLRGVEIGGLVVFETGDPCGTGEVAAGIELWAREGRQSRLQKDRSRCRFAGQFALRVMDFGGNCGGDQQQGEQQSEGTRQHECSCKPNRGVVVRDGHQADALT